MVPISKSRIQDRFRKSFGTKLEALIGIQCLIWLLMLVLSLIIGSTKWVGEWLGLLPDFESLSHRLWGLFSYMWLHNSLWHLGINCCLLFLIGQLFIRQYSSKYLWISFTCGGILGGGFYVLGYNLLHLGLGMGLLSQPLLGSSAAVLSLLFAASFGKPALSIHIPFWGRTQLKHIGYVAGMLVLLEFIWGIVHPTSSHLGSGMAHLGGCLGGLLPAWLLRRTIRSSSTIRRTVKKRDKEDILNKIRHSGYSSLNKEEKEILLKDKKDGFEKTS
ncbi:hypothetical protein HQ45_01915 [Porphyromonas crevioricanis]|uniref:Rhomboid family n=2 Tax=Porphyromonas crevioricanis TaxID=393921 RepID=A0A0A2FIV1_9PORP|nr:rhomboid family intramembrane serine protease [Porphyromonas crevioricanis]KGN90893.1 hypothetical protein HQ45_01915 [Porphyromonas crevioricanis]SJZ54086.1 Membrane associated serine protease, rhomboid family [Porphyromonas crevioricanis]SQH73272.1 Rhomboid family [Porphyromonas crevioricanis]GAD06255.1 rhomboid family protein [Porphyromonas crevioricanis JCM 15906]GAD06771.1 rhomboid family protein [Porphyromonas crevioricanis JCM 13913]